MKDGLPGDHHILSLILTEIFAGIGISVPPRKITARYIQTNTMSFFE